MNEMRATPAAVPATADEVDLLDYVIVLWRGKVLVTVVTAVATLLAAVLVVVLPRYYVATAALLSPHEDTATGSLTTLANSLLGSGGASALGSAASGTNRDMLMGVLKSRSVVQAVVEKFDLKTRYGVGTMDGAVKKLRDEYTLVELTKEFVVAISVTDTDPRVAADVANHYVILVEKIVGGFSTSYAGRQRVFVQGQLVRAKSDLAASEERMRKFQETNGAIVLQEQTRGTIEAAAQLKAQVIAHEIQLQVMRTFATEANPDVVTLRQRIGEMKRQLTDIQYGNGVPVPRSKNGSGDKPDFAVPFVSVPELGLELVRLTRDVRIQEVLVTLLIQQLEQARIAEVKDLPIVRVLDRALPPEKPSKPNVMLLMALGVVGGGFVGVMTVFLREYFRRLSRLPRHV